MLCHIRTLGFAALLLASSAVVPMTASADPGDFVMIAGAGVAEGASGQADQAVFTVSLFGKVTSDTDVTFRFQTTPMHISTQAGDAVEGAACSGQVDYIGQNRIVTLPANTLQVSITVPICGDSVSEPSEHFGGLLFDVTNAS